MRHSLLLSEIVFYLLFSCTAQQSIDYRTLIEQGEFVQARLAIEKALREEQNLTMKQQSDLQFEIERLERIKKDFGKTQTQVVEFIKQYIPTVTYRDLDRWEKEKSLESMMIDGEKRYFNNAARNLFRLDKKCLAIWKEKHPGEDAYNESAFNLDTHDQDIINECLKRGDRYANPVRMRIHYSITVKADAVPEHETIRCWIPFPREIANRQTDIALIKIEPVHYQLAPNKDLQRMIYFEKTAKKGEPASFSVEYEYMTQGVYVDINPKVVSAIDTGNSNLQPFLQEEPPHIVFTDSLRALSSRIVGDETNPYRIAQILFEWVDINVPWASAREYSTVPNIPMYAFENRHGDCGMQTLLFITLCRMNGIPTRWQSGWEFKPPDEDSMHDWGMIYFEPYGWAPMDVTYGRRKSNDVKLKWFYLNGMDSYRLIFNDAISQPFTPAKEHFRSETVDSQRGEVEWKGGNLYFDQWEWEMKWEVLAR